MYSQKQSNEVTGLLPYLQFFRNCKLRHSLAVPMFLAPGVNAARRAK